MYGSKVLRLTDINADIFGLRLKKVLFFWLETNQFGASHFKFHLVFTQTILGTITSAIHNPICLN